MRSKPSIDYFPLVANLSKEKRKRIDVTPSKAIKLTVKKRKLVLRENFPSEAKSEGEGNGTREEDSEPMPQMVEQKAEPETEGERAVVVEEGEREEPGESHDVELPHEVAKGGEAEGEKKVEYARGIRITFRGSMFQTNIWVL